MTTAEIYDLLEARGIDATAFWAHAMGGDRAAMPREDVLRCLCEMGSYVLTVTEIAPSSCTDTEGAIDAVIHRDGAYVCDVTLLPSEHDGELSTWGSLDHWCSRPDALPADTRERRQWVDAIVDAVRAAVPS